MPIVYIVSTYDSDESIETEFLSLFMALEALLDIYAKSRNKHKIFSDKKEWKTFHGHMKNAIDKYSDFSDKDRMTNKLGLFNETSKKDIYNDFCKEMIIDNSDLWPLYKGNDNKLSEIRNKLVHGKGFDLWPHISYATTHLKWIVERCLLSVLGWKKETEIFHKEALKKYYPYRDWEKYYNKK